MEIFLKYLMVFLVGGLVCLVGQILIITTQITTARILVLFELFGVFLEGVGIYDAIFNFAHAGISVPIIGFGAALAKGAISAVHSRGIIGIFTGGLEATAGGIAAAVIFAFIFSLLFRPRTKKT